MIFLSTTLVDVSAQTEAEPGEGRTASVRASGVRAVVSAPSGAEIAAPGGGSERIDAVLISDPISGMAHTDTVTDGTDVYEVAWVTQRTGFGLDHTQAGLVKIAGHV